MTHADVCWLIAKTYQTDALGQRIPSETARQVFCSIGSVSRAEWSSAGQAGLSPAFVISVFFGDYNGEEICSLRGERFGVYRTYMRNDEQIELYLERKVGDDG